MGARSQQASKSGGRNLSWCGKHRLRGRWQALSWKKIKHWPIAWAHAVPPPFRFFLARSVLPRSRSSSRHSPRDRGPTSQVDEPALVSVVGVEFFFFLCGRTFVRPAALSRRRVFFSFGHVVSAAAQRNSWSSDGARNCSALAATGLYAIDETQRGASAASAERWRVADRPLLGRLELYAHRALQA